MVHWILIISEVQRTFFLSFNPTYTNTHTETCAKDRKSKVTKRHLAENLRSNSGNSFLYGTPIDCVTIVSLTTRDTLQVAHKIPEFRRTY